MTQEEKELLLIDLCARLPYMPKIKITYQQQGIKGTDEGRVSCDFIEKIVNDLRNGVITDMQIYLRPMSSMTEEEMDKLADFHIWNDGEKIFPDCNCKLSDIVSAMNWLNKKMFDYRGLIEKGLALEAPEGMYNIKNK